MKKNFNSIQEFADNLNKKIIKAMDCVGEKALKHMKNYVKNKLEENEPEVYKRTWEYLNSIDRIQAHMNSDGSIETMIYYNTDKITPYLPASVFNDYTGYQMDVSQNWGWHTSFDGTDVSSFIPLWKEYGTNNPYYSHEPIGGIIDLKQWVQDNFKKQLAIELRKQGIQTK